MIPAERPELYARECRGGGRGGEGGVGWDEQRGRGGLWEEIDVHGEVKSRGKSQR